MTLPHRMQYLNAMDVPIWVPRGYHGLKPAPVIGGAVALQTDTAVPEESTDYTNFDWQALARSVEQCQKCELHKTRKTTVFGTGNQEANWLFIGEAPGADEDRQGEPFVGRAGQLLNAMLFALGLKREQVYIANVLKCRPPNNRDPRPDEVKKCEPYLARQIQLLQPGVIITLGRHAAHNLLKTELSLGRLRGQRMNYQNIPVVVTYHPAYLLRNPADKRKAWEDLCLARSIVEKS